ncbi:hypothetical protein FOVG_19594 [Fusarium oxysporum f. sp. pisi HDV247]|uniref:Rhodopsin domain-containing protein n=1 Tax=Fusarium oxysporum f. sp. pisi HDV247 TaxID=1080344 RepID=W9N8A0_FUSOX|nr:hypothetical protein FOVG_19594 [Fusarium oxysporum f. sp. pisi HDV247]
MANATNEPTSESATLGPDHSATYLVPFSIVMAIVIISTVARIYCRIRPQWRLAWDDYTLIFAFALTTTWFSLMVLEYSKYGRAIEKYPHDPSIMGPIETAMGLLFFWALNVVRISMCLMLLRLKDERAWRWALRSLIVLQVCLIIVATCVQLACCRPLSGLWAPTPDTRCIPTEDFRRYWITHYSFHIFCDFVISLMPLTFIYAMHRSLLEKVLLCGLMGAGLAATAAALVFLIILVGCFGFCRDALFNVRLDICTSLQLFLGVIAANLPCLKAPVHHILIQWGIVQTAKHPSADGCSPESFLSKMTHGSHLAEQLHDLSWNSCRPLASSYRDNKKVSHAVTESSLD